MMFPVVVVLFFAPLVLSQNLQVNTPTSVMSCEPIQLAWTGGVPPYYLSFVPAGQTSATPLIQFPPQNGNTYTWMANLAAGTIFTIALRDGEGIEAFSDKVTVLAGPQTSCDSTTSSSSDTSPGSVPAIADTSSTEPPGTTSALANGPMSGFPAQTTASAAPPKINPQSTASFASPPKATAKKQRNASYKITGNMLRAILPSVGLFVIAFIL